MNEKAGKEAAVLLRPGGGAGPIPFVDRKEPDWAFLSEVLEESRRSGFWANYGPTSQRLESEARRLLALPEERAFVACSSGTTALHALVGLY